MRHSVSSSDFRASTLAFLTCLALLPLSTRAKTFLSVEDALKSAFPGCTTRREAVYLSVEQMRAASQLAKTEVSDSVITRYLASCEKDEGGFAYLDTHIVRTHRETLFITLSRDAKLKRVEVLTFLEPPEYVPRSKWYDQFKDRILDGDLQLKRGIAPVTGASLTARVTTEAARRILAIHQIVSKEGK